MASTIVVIIKIMPESVSTNLKQIEEQVRKKLEPHGGRNITFEEKEIAFGLKSITLKMAFPEEKGTDLIENLIHEVPEVSSVTIEDYRRAFG
ncbi:MAG: elongation factor 1-beta [Nanoarchaeota archaeon]